MQLLRISLLATLFSLASCPRPVATDRAPPLPAAPSCTQTLAAFDIGSATTKLQVAEVDVCAHRIIRPLLRATQPVPLGEDVAQYHNVRDDTLDRAVTALSSLMQLARGQHPNTTLAVATEALRRAQNGGAVVDRIEREVGLRVTIIAQEREATLAFWGALMAEPSRSQSAVVWDVGGESMQLTALARDRVEIFGVDFATNDMRRYLVELQHKSADASPNPVNAEQAGLAVDYARKHAVAGQPSWLRLRLERQDALVIGVGAIRYYPDPGSGDSWATRAGLERALSNSLDKSDAELGGAYAPVRVAALALIMGSMDALGVTRLRVVDVDLTDGLLATYVP